jgi:ATP-dependent exoDNAse (exonuclease V) beta subunit
MLKKNNFHIRDNNIKYIKDSSSRYIITTDVDSKYVSVTNWVHSNFCSFDSDNVIDKMMKSKSWSNSKYNNKSKEEIIREWNINSKKSSNYGIHLHKYIEIFMNLETDVEKPNHSDLLEAYVLNEELFENIINTKEWDYFINFVDTYPKLIPYRSEWFIYNEDIKICGTIDMVYENPDGSLSVYDWKRCKSLSKYSYGKFSTHKLLKSIPDANYYRYHLQLSMYRFILENKYDKKVTSIHLVNFHPNNTERNYEIYTLPRFDVDIELLF